MIRKVSTMTADELAERLAFHPDTEITWDEIAELPALEESQEHDLIAESYNYGIRVWVSRTDQANDQIPPGVVLETRDSGGNWTERPFELVS